MRCLKTVIAVSIAAALAAVFCGCGSENAERNAKREISSQNSTVSSETESLIDEDSSYLENIQSESESEEESTADSENAVPEVFNESFDEQETESVSEEESQIEDNIRHEKLAEIISNSGATGYTIGHVENSENDFLMLSFGEIEASRYYDVYRIDNDDVVLAQSMLVGSHTVVYVAENTGCLAIYQGHMGHYGYGDLMYSGDGVSINWLEDNGVIGDDEDYPPVPGEVVTFTPIDDLSMISIF